MRVLPGLQGGEQHNFQRPLLIVSHRQTTGDAGHALLSVNFVYQKSQGETANLGRCEIPKKTETHASQTGAQRYIFFASRQGQNEIAHW